MIEATEQRAEVFDVAQALSSVGGDREFLAEVVGLIQAAWPTLLADIRKGMAQSDLYEVGAKARLAVAAARYVSARRTYEAARGLESIAAKEDWEGAREAMVNLEREVEILQFFLATLDYLD